MGNHPTRKPRYYDCHNVPRMFEMSLEKLTNIKKKMKGSNIQNLYLLKKNGLLQ
jgi:hypothetical protein